MAALRKPAATVVKLKPETHAKLQEIAKTTHRPMGEVVSELVERYEREKFWQEANASMERLRADPVAWKAYQDELAIWDQTAGDGLENEEPYYTPEEERDILANAQRSQDG
ncbi:MAG TPA: hypothetical protein VNZ55_09515 [Thermomicrobiales bacterium]|nr:hypothetical protein [Thermomicrobiales bacterium]